MKQSDPYRSSMSFRKPAGILRRPFSSTFAGACPIKTFGSIPSRFSVEQWLVLPLLSPSVHLFPPLVEKERRDPRTDRAHATAGQQLLDLDAGVLGDRRRGPTFIADGEVAEVAPRLDR